MDGAEETAATGVAVVIVELEEVGRCEDERKLLKKVEVVEVVEVVELVELVELVEVTVLVPVEPIFVMVRVDVSAAPRVSNGAAISKLSSLRWSQGASLKQPSK